jgi:glutamyl/glutaminyl-tRNA synthetase
MKKIPEIGEMTEFFFKEPKYKAGLLKWPTARGRARPLGKNMKKKEIQDSLNKLEEILSKSKLGDFKEQLLNMEDRGRLLWPLRVALTGREKSPGPFEIGEILGKKQVLKRIKYAQKLVK